MIFSIFQYGKEKATLEELMPKDKTEADLKKAAEEKAAQWYDFRIFVLLQVITFQKVPLFKGG